MTLRVAFRVDSSSSIGSGHVMRCLALADGLRACGARCIFICRSDPGNLNALIQRKGFEVRALSHAVFGAGPGKASSPCSTWLETSLQADRDETLLRLGNETLDWVIVDHYALDREWEHAIRVACRRVMAIDDLADRKHDCDLLLDHNLGRSAEDYAGLVQPGAVLLLGPRFALLRPEFRRWRPYSLARRMEGRVSALLISFGGLSFANQTCAVLEALRSCQLPNCMEITAVVGLNTDSQTQIQRLADAMPWPTRVLSGVENMGKIMADSDLAIGAAGTSAWERCALGLPSLTFVLASNQRAGAVALQERGCAVLVPSVAELSPSVEFLVTEPGGSNFIRAMSLAASLQVDGRGVARVRQELMHANVVA